MTSKFKSNIKVVVSGIVLSSYVHEIQLNPLSPTMFGANLGRLSDFVAKYINVLVDTIWMKIDHKTHATLI